ncbi:ER lumen protein-retaining receptor 1 [Malaclemys terrapin pileata]|uniref:ER lumen protein-retaining receptor 1 n=1 Tax=Malaclemys terrapin pileata TaxID=2991368 RepID=UPI0023A8C202|nr:ER lumen protein-retaining receptor 1 [Malaclemys terrapin pileata]
MNIFRFLGDISHLLAIIILLMKIWKTRSCAGISGKSQILFAVVFTTRYLDLVTNFISFYNTSMKVVYITCSYATVWLIYSKFKATYDGNHDTFRVEFLVVPTAVLAFLVNHDFTPLEILWTFSIYLESVAILPQLFMVSKTGEAETITKPLSLRPGHVPHPLPLQLDLALPAGGFFDLIAIVAGLGADHPLLRLLLPLHHKSSKGEEAEFASVVASCSRCPPSAPRRKPVHMQTTDTYRF